MTALLAQAMLLGRLLVAADPAAAGAPAPGVNNAPVDSPVPQPAPPTVTNPPPASDAPASKAPSPVPWKTISKAGAGVSYAVWVALWTLMVPVGFVGLTLIGLSVGHANSGLLAGGSLLVAVTVALFVLGAAAAITGAGFGIATTVQQLLHPDPQAVDSTLSMVAPLTLLL